MDYIFANRDLAKYVYHTRPEDEIGVRTGQDEENSIHHWVVADLPFTALGNASPPINRAAAYPHRINVNLANKQERAKLVEAATPAIAAWEVNIPSDVTAAFVSEGVLPNPPKHSGPGAMQP
jgi:hypothetical protein